MDTLQGSFSFAKAFLNTMEDRNYESLGWVKVVRYA